ncbi:Uncharacterised protein [uncultured Roseburia sp.]|uniref:DHHW family protein n=1 Tax=Brotonthovivens ammoniilytica TaxID=2981725 RepID=A0ABT2TNF3_9FIRM|nr:DHHW family protein [Brotonthovivens ammoniilytica]MCU6763745.1 DHHW family protein [Brotonthovivens ammoniilytica]SCJ33530.1 Uncharacterised protein [uncultured Roseburia sp.]
MTKQVGKVFGVTLLAVSCVGLAAGCGKKESVEMDTKSLAQELQDSGIFEGTLKEADASTASYMVAAAKDTNVELYMGEDGSKSDEILILTGKDSSSTEENKSAAETHLKDITSSFEDYIPEEAAKAENAVLVDQDKYVVLCISDDSDTAKQIIEKYLNGEGKQAKADTDSKKKTNSSDGTSADVEDKTSDSGSDSGETDKTPEPDYDKIESNDSVKKYGGVAAVGNQGFEIYNYHENAAKNYASLVTKAADKLKGVSTVYDLIPPTSVGITFPDNLKDKISSSDQAEALDKIHGFMGASVKSVDLYDNLMKHRTEYIYFRTDHHWTALGAYYAYEQFCNEKGIKPNALADYKTVEYSGFLGSFYKDTKNSKALGNTPDTIKAYLPKGKASLDVTAQDGQKYTWDVIHDVSDYGASLKYSTFIAGDNPMTVIKNSDITDGSSCVVVKESFGNAFIPFLVDHYQTIYVIDYRYWNGDVASFAKEKKAGDVIFINNISMTRSDFLIGKLAKVIK